MKRSRIMIAAVVFASVSFAAVHAADEGRKQTGAQDAASPSISFILPSEGSWQGGTRIVIIGSGLLGATAVRFGEIEATQVVPQSEIALEVVVPAVAAPGETVDVTVTTDGGEALLAKAFTYTDTGGEGEGEGEGEPLPSCYGESPQSPAYCGTMTTYRQKALIPQTVVCCVWEVQTGKAILDATLSLAGAGESLVDGSADGTYSFPAVDPGYYDLTLDVPNYGICHYAFTVGNDEILALTFPIGDVDELASAPLSPVPHPTMAARFLRNRGFKDQKADLAVFASAPILFLLFGTAKRRR